jgi:hypothetical protein
MGMAAPVYYTADMVRALPEDGNRYEAVFGELLVTPSPRVWHQVIVGRLLEVLTAYLHRYPVGYALSSPADISWSADTLVQPDVLCQARDARRVCGLVTGRCGGAARYPARGAVQSHLVGGCTSPQRRLRDRGTAQESLTQLVVARRNG